MVRIRRLTIWPIRLDRIAGAIIILLLATIITSPALAELSAESAIELYRQKDPQLILFLNGLGQGFSWANTLLRDGKEPLFCVPGKVALTVDQQVDILARYIQEIPADASLPVGGVMIHALRDAFPCK
jgi:hypothetical protein